MWFKDSAIDSLSEDKVTISVSSDTAKDYIEENYMPIVKEALRRITAWFRSRSNCSEKNTLMFSQITR